MILTLGGFFVFIGLFLMGYGYADQKEMFVVAGGVILMLAATAFVSEGIDVASGTSVTDFQNGTLISATVFTNYNNVWTLGLGRSLFYLSYLGLLLYTIHSVLQDKKV